MSIYSNPEELKRRQEQMKWRWERKKEILKLKKIELTRKFSPLK